MKYLGLAISNMEKLNSIKINIWGNELGVYGVGEFV